MPSPPRARRTTVGRTAVLTTAVVLAAVWPTSGAAQGGSDIQSTCSACHPAAAGPEHARALNHADAVSCLTCHHIGFTNDPRAAAVRRLDACASCHEALPRPHEGLEGSTPTCNDCHTLHDDPPVEEAGAVISARCAACHEAPHALHSGAGPEAPVCTDCHTLHTPGTPVPSSVQRSCVSCHEGVHPSHPTGGVDAVTCTTCHALNAGAPVALSGTALDRTCVSCHEDLPAGHGAHGGSEVGGGTASGTGADAGAHAAGGSAERPAACTDCHAFATDPRLPGADTAVARRCGSCHQEAMGAYLRGGHAAGLADDPNPDLPTCVTCHDVHAQEGENEGYVRLAATIRCVDCHSDAVLAERYDLPPKAGASYTDDFHGATVRFLWDHPEGEGQPDVLTCADCHGAHAVSPVTEAQVSRVCLGCHEDGDPKLAGAWLGHTPAGPDHQVPIWLLRLFYYVFIPFMLAGLTLHIAMHLMAQRRGGARVLKTEGMQRLKAAIKGEKAPKPRMVQRFSLVERLEHLGAMVSFTLLVITGLPQTQPNLPVARAVIGLFGGIGTTRLIHRSVGVLFVALLVAHLVRTVRRALKRRQLPVMVPTPQDFPDAMNTVKHFIRGTPRPKVGKFDFFQKFEYWGLFLGGVVMASTGTLLLFPELATDVLPGMVVAAGRYMHGMEATFATLVVLLWHTYGVVLRPEIFPLDTSIFTGKVTVERLKHEHELEYERLFPTEAAHDAPLEETRDDDRATEAPPQLAEV